MNLVTYRTVNVIRFEGDLIQTSEIQGESHSIMSLNLCTNCSIMPSSPYGACMVCHVCISDVHVFD